MNTSPSMASGSLPLRFFQHLVADNPEAVIYADAAGIIRYWNAAATRIFGFAEAEAIGARLDLIIPERLRGRHWEGYEKVIGGTPSRYGSGGLLAVPARHKDGRQISIEFTILPLRGDAGSLLGIAAFLRDVTTRFEEMRALRRELAAAKPSH
ncbi:MAG TPA: PAS domain S-box protein [Acetobacteraceae bacterium]|jgi:PAS domain S-box-containing protein|nr:PAS domain S-box protein [Acetobacteraceae bacterium]